MTSDDETLKIIINELNLNNISNLNETYNNIKSNILPLCIKIKNHFKNDQKSFSITSIHRLLKHFIHFIIYYYQYRLIEYDKKKNIIIDKEIFNFIQDMLYIIWNPVDLNEKKTEINLNEFTWITSIMYLEGLLSKSVCMDLLIDLSKEDRNYVDDLFKIMKNLIIKSFNNNITIYYSTYGLSLLQDHLIYKKLYDIIETNEKILQFKENHDRKMLMINNDFLFTCINKYILKWYLKMLVFPYITKYNELKNNKLNANQGDKLGLIFRLVFPLLDNSQSKNEEIGWEIFYHILKNITATEIEWYREPIIKMIENIIETSKSHKTMDYALKSMEHIMKETNTLKNPKETNLYIYFIPIIVGRMRFISDDSIKILFTKYLSFFSKDIGAISGCFLLIKFLDIILEIIYLNLRSNTSVAKLVIISFEALEDIIYGAAIRIKFHVNDILANLLYVVAFYSFLDSTPNKDQKQLNKNTNEIINKSDKLIELLFNINNKMVMESLKKIEKECPILRKYCQQKISMLPIP